MWPIVACAMIGLRMKYFEIRLRFRVSNTLEEPEHYEIEEVVIRSYAIEYEDALNHGLAMKAMLNHNGLLKYINITLVEL